MFLHTLRDISKSDVLHNKKTPDLASIVGDKVAVASTAGIVVAVGTVTVIPSALRVTVANGVADALAELVWSVGSLVALMMMGAMTVPPHGGR